MNEQYLDIGGLKILVDEVLKSIEKNGSVVTVKKLTDLPLIGKQNVQYVIEELDEIYRWDDDNIKYYCIGTNYHNIEIINGGGQPKLIGC